MGRGRSLGEQLLEEALLLSLAALGTLRPRALLGGPATQGPLLTQVGVAADQVHRALDVRKHLHLLHLHTDREMRVSVDGWMEGGREG